MPVAGTGQFDGSSPSKRTLTVAELILQNKATTCEFIKDRLYYAMLQGKPPSPTTAANVHFFQVDDQLQYFPFYCDFGPNNIAQLVRFINIVDAKLRDVELKDKRLCLWTLASAYDRRANCAFMISAYMMIRQNLSPEDAWAPLDHVTPPFAMYRDAGYGPSTYHISIPDILFGLHRAIELGLLNIHRVDGVEYEYYERVENGDFNWLTDKFLALASPKDEKPTSPVGMSTRTPPTSQQNLQEAAQFEASLATPTSVGSDELTCYTLQDSDAPCQRPLRDHDLFSCSKVPELIRYFKLNNVTAIVRLNNRLYDKKSFEEAGIKHYDLYFPDGSNPPEHIIRRFWDICENTPGTIAVHCKAGLGRTGTLIALYLMKHYLFTAAEAISFLRVMRPGSVVGPQQNFLVSAQAWAWSQHEKGKVLRPEIGMLGDTDRLRQVVKIVDDMDIVVSQEEATQRLKLNKKRSTMDLTPDSATPQLRRSSRRRKLASGDASEDEEENVHPLVASESRSDIALEAAESHAALEIQTDNLAIPAQPRKYRDDDNGPRELIEQPIDDETKVIVIAPPSTLSLHQHAPVTPPPARPVSITRTTTITTTVTPVSPSTPPSTKFRPKVLVTPTTPPALPTPPAAGSTGFKATLGMLFGFKSAPSTPSPKTAQSTSSAKSQEI